MKTKNLTYVAPIIFILYGIYSLLRTKGTVNVGGTAVDSDLCGDRKTGVISIGLGILLAILNYFAKD